MIPVDYKIGIRVEPYRKGVFLGLGFTWFTERAVQIDVLLWSISIGVVYNDREDY